MIAQCNRTTMEMDDDLLELAKDNDLSLDEAEEVQNMADELGVDLDDAFEIWQAQ